MAFAGTAGVAAAAGGPGCGGVPAGGPPDGAAGTGWTQDRERQQDQGESGLRRQRQRGQDHEV
ncbi:hypothetical protein KXS07_35310, partial [Inquilinus limosus]|uniref:hypothetical protein n=1 Tax=Inquilinus limosus TaxID=171674 RepID=UPI003F16D641